MKFWRKTFFWDMVIKILALFGPTGGVVTGKYLDDPIWTGIGLFCLAAGGILAIIFVDKDKNGVVDIFEE
jgi:hypothetical protein